MRKQLGLNVFFISAYAIYSICYIIYSIVDFAIFRKLDNLKKGIKKTKKLEKKRSLPTK